MKIKILLSIMTVFALLSFTACGTDSQNITNNLRKMQNNGYTSGYYYDYINNGDGYAKYYDGLGYGDGLGTDTGDGSGYESVINGSGNSSANGYVNGYESIPFN